MNTGAAVVLLNGAAVHNEVRAFAQNDAALTTARRNNAIERKIRRVRRRSFDRKDARLRVPVLFGIVLKGVRVDGYAQTFRRVDRFRLGEFSRNPLADQLAVFVNRRLEFALVQLSAHELERIVGVALRNDDVDRLRLRFRYELVRDGLFAELNLARVDRHGVLNGDRVVLILFGEVDYEIVVCERINVEAVFAIN